MVCLMKIFTKASWTITVVAIILAISVSSKAETQVHSYGCTDFPVTLNEVTLATQFKWGAQAFLAPERLVELIPLYAYPMHEINIDDFKKYLKQQVESETAQYPDYRIGAAVVQEKEVQNDWQASPFATATLDSATDTISKFYSSCADARNDKHGWYMVTDVAIVGLVEQAEILWATKTDLSGS